MTTNPAARSLHRTAFRVVAFAEALSWLGLLIGMYFKWIADAGEGGVKVFGPVHGTIFILYVLVTLWVSRAFRWDAKTTFLGLVSSIPPFCTAIFELWADHRGQLTPVRPAPVAEVPA